MVHPNPLEEMKPPDSGCQTRAGFFSSTCHGAGLLIGAGQRNYQERIIRNEQEMDATWRYTEANPVNWGDDEENPQNVNA